jgi:serine/threonine protein kinase
LITNDEIPVVVLCDFGLGKLVATEPGPPPTAFTTAGQVPLPSHYAAETIYTAPEVAAGKPYTSEADIYAAGVFMIVAFRSYAGQTKSLGLDEATVQVPRPLWEMCKRCTAVEPTDRPSALTVVGELETLSEDDFSAGRFDLVDFGGVLREWNARRVTAGTPSSKLEAMDEDSMTMDSRFAASSLSGWEGSKVPSRS